MFKYTIIERFRVFLNVLHTKKNNSDAKTSSVLSTDAAMLQVVLSWPLSVRTMTSHGTSGDLPDERGSLPLDIDDVHILLQG